ncbi:MAG: hypothetical protein ACRD50_15920 [Candidatus Acidiferrales bacterium]
MPHLNEWIEKLSHASADVRRAAAAELYALGCSWADAAISPVPVTRRVNSRLWVSDCYFHLSPTIPSRAAALAYIDLMRDNARTGFDVAVGPKRPGFTVMGIFLFFGAMMASLAAITLLRRGTALDRLWTLNPMAYKQLAPLGSMVGILFLLLGTVLAAAGIGWFRRRLWGWRLAVIIIATQVLRNVVSCVRGDFLRGGAGFLIASALLLFLSQRKTRATFA